MIEYFLCAAALLKNGFITGVSLPRLHLQCLESETGFQDVQVSNLVLLINFTLQISCQHF